MTGALNFSGENSRNLTWNDATYQQRIHTVDDAQPNTNVFVFQQSSNSGSTWTDLMSIKDNGQIVASTFVGSLTGNASTATALTTSSAGGLRNPVYFTNGQPAAGAVTFNNLNANRLVRTTSTADNLYAGDHYASQTKIAINSTSEPAENFYVNGTTRFAIGSSDNTSNKCFIIGSVGRRYLSFGGAGVQAYTANNTYGKLFLQYSGGDISIGESTAVSTGLFNITTATMTGAYTFNSANGFNYSGIGVSETNSSRPVWFSSDGTVGRPVYNNNFQYNPGLNKLSTGNLQLTGELEVTGNAYLYNQTTADSLIAGSLIVNGNANFVQIPTAPTAAEGTNNTQLATTAFVKNSITSLSTAMHFIGKATASIADESTTDPAIYGYDFVSDRKPGDVIIDKDGFYEYVWTQNGAWERLGPDGSYKMIQSAVGDPTANGNATAFIDSISQDANGVITVTKKNLDTSGTWSGNATTATTASKLSNTSKIGDINKPVYFTASGVPSAISYTINKSVPSNAVFTDTLVQQTATNLSENVEYNILTTTEASPNTGARETKYGVNITYNPSLNRLSTGNINLTGELNVTGNTYLHNQTIIDTLTTGNLSVTGVINGQLNHKIKIGNYEYDGSSDITIPIYDGATS